MRKLIILALLLLCPIQTHAFSAAIQAALGVVASGCTASDPDNDYCEIGKMAVGATTGTATVEGKIYCQLRTADGTGTLATAYVYSKTIDSKYPSNLVVSVYSTTDTTAASAPTNGTRLGYTGEITNDATSGWDNGAMSGGSITNGSKYWLCVTTDSTTSQRPYFNYDTGVSRHSIDSSDHPVPPESLATTGWGTTADRDMSIFVGIGP